MKGFSRFIIGSKNGTEHCKVCILVLPRMKDSLLPGNGGSLPFCKFSGKDHLSGKNYLTLPSRVFMVILVSADSGNERGK